MEKYCRITDLNNADLAEFRKRAIIECGGSDEHLHYKGYHSKFMEILDKNNVKRKEDIYRFTDEKWYRTKFDHIDTFYAADGKITSISGVIEYNNWVRTAVYQFALREYSKEYPSRYFWKGGFLERAIEYAKVNNKKGVFMTFYPHNAQLKALCKKLIDGTGIPTSTGNYELIRALKFKGMHSFNDVDQNFFVIELNNNQFNIDEIHQAQ